MENRRPKRPGSYGQKRSYGSGKNGENSRPQGFQRSDSSSNRGRSGTTAKGDRPQSRPKRPNFVSENAAGYGSGYRKPNRGNRPSNGRFVKNKQTGKHDSEPRVRLISDLQISDGKYRAKLLSNSDSIRAAPTPRRLREVIFRNIYRRVRARRFLDLCAGCGTVGIEAISRGAMLGTFVDRSARMCSFSRKNLEALGIKDGHGEIVEKELLPFLKDARKRKRSWDVVYFDLNSCDDTEQVLKHFERGTTVAPGGMLLIAHATETELPEKLGILYRHKSVVHEPTTVSIYERK